MKKANVCMKATTKCYDFYEWFCVDIDVLPGGGEGGGGCGTQRTQMRQEGAKNPASLILKGQVWRKI